MTANEPLTGADTVFYIEASANVGMGHMARSAALVEALAERGIDSRVVLRVDDQARARAHEKGLTSREVEVVPGVPIPSSVVIDAVTLPRDDVRALSESPRRILISPACDRPEIATHALLRGAPEGLRGRLSPDCVLVEDARFAYVTASGLTCRALDFSGSLVVGLCLSGGGDQPGIDALLRVARASPGVEAVHVIHPDISDIADAMPPVHHQAFCNDLWAFFSPVNVFITGDGVMVAEAVAQGLPCMSITRPGAPEKNRGLVGAGCVAVENIDDAPSAMASLLQDRARLTEMHRAAVAQSAGQDAKALARAILHLVQSERT